MLRRPALLACLLAALLFWQAATAAAHCLAAAGAATVMEICGPDGLRLLPLADDEAIHAEAVCAVCHLLPALALPPPDRPSLPRLLAVEAVAPDLFATETLHPAPAAAYRPTGPPILL